MTELATPHVGQISLRHSIAHPFRAEAGGHVGYAGSDLDNVASARTIESCGGVLEDERSGKRRYWVSTS